MGKQGMQAKFLLESLNGRDHSEASITIILKWILQQWVTKIWTGLG